MNGVTADWCSDRGICLIRRQEDALNLMKERVISGIVIGVLAVVLGVAGGPALGAVLMVCSMLDYYELTRAFGVVGGEHGRFNALEITGLVISALYYMALIYYSMTEVTMKETDTIFTRGPIDPLPFIDNADSLAWIAIILIFLTEMIVFIVTYPRFETSQVLASIFSFIYAPLMISCIYRAEYLPYGIFVYAMIFFCSWVSDTCAYLVGRAFGKHKMTPRLSPNKTKEGAVGGIAGSVILCVAAAGVVSYLSPGSNVYLPFAILGLFGSILGMIGDLAASAIKRSHGIKDYGHIIPGHGGIMDRFDSVIFTAPAIYLLGMLLLA